MDWAIFGKALAEAVKEVTKLTAQILSGKEVARLKYRCEAATQYVFVDEKVGQFAKLSDDGVEKMKLHFRKRIFDEN
jgi:hypothetical protein